MLTTSYCTYNSVTAVKHDHLSAGTSVGGVLYSVLQGELIQLFGVDGCLLVVGALALNVVAFAGLMRPLTPSKYYLQQHAAVSGRAAEEPSNQKPSAKDLVIAMETKELPVTCSASIKIKTRRYCQ